MPAEQCRLYISVMITHPHPFPDEPVTSEEGDTIFRETNNYRLLIWFVELIVLYVYTRTYKLSRETKRPEERLMLHKFGKIYALEKYFDQVVLY